MYKALPERQGLLVVHHGRLPALWQTKVVDEAVPLPIVFAKEGCLQMTAISLLPRRRITLK